jgi:hypothetical protein
MEFQTGHMNFEKRARNLAVRFDADCEQTTVALRRLLADNLPSLIEQEDELPESYAVDLAESALEGAYRALTWQKAIEFLKGLSAAELATHLRVSRLLAGTNSDYGVPLYSRHELADQLIDFNRFLQADHEHLLKTGLPSKSFGGSRWLSSQLAKLYPVRCTENDEPFEEPVTYRGEKVAYYWSKVVRDLCRLEIHEVRVPQDDADFLEGFTAAEAVKLELLREKVLELKHSVLEEAVQELQSSGESDLWEKCLPHLVATLSADEAEFLSRMDAAYRNPPAGRNLSHALAAMLRTRIPSEPGGFSNLIELVGHVQQECMIGTMHRTREALGEFVADDGDHPVLSSASAWSYFDFVDDDYAQETIESAISQFLECEAREREFWAAFRNRVESAVSEKFDREITIEVRSKPSIAERLRGNIASYADFAKNSFDASGKLPALKLAPTALANDNFDQPPFAKDNVPDGPCPPFTWRHEGKIVKDNMQPAAWKMVKHLWQAAELSATTDDLKLPVYDDAERETGENEFGSLRRAANSFFKEHKIPWRITIKKRVVGLVPTK